MGRNLFVMIVDGGARGHVISGAYEKSEQVGKIVVVPGNDFVAHGREKEVFVDGDCSLKDAASILRLAQKYRPDIVDVAQDDALAAGTVDLLRENGFRVFGPKKSAARIEWDKKWSREFMERYGIPQPEFRYFSDEGLAKEYVGKLYRENPNRLLYVKAAGLCYGKGALKSENLDEAVHNIEMMKTFEDGAGDVFLIEEGLVGEEFSCYAISDGNSFHLFKSAQDNKTVYNFDKGGQTGGMGAIAPAKITNDFVDEIKERMISKVIRGMAIDNNEFVGILFLGGIVVDGKPMVIEYNARWGDPECQVVLPSVESDYVDIVEACMDGRLGELDIRQDNKTRVCVVGASRGYPDDYSYVKGKGIYGLEDVKKMENVSVFGAGIVARDGKFYANGGRLFSVVAKGEDILEAKELAYAAIARINIEGNGLHYRTDIGWRDVNRYLSV